MCQLCRGGYRCNHLRIDKRHFIVKLFRNMVRNRTQCGRGRDGRHRDRLRGARQVQEGAAHIRGRAGNGVEFEFHALRFRV